MVDADGAVTNEDTVVEQQRPFNAKKMCYLLLNSKLHNWKQKLTHVVSRLQRASVSLQARQTKVKATATLHLPPTVCLILLETLPKTQKPAPPAQALLTWQQIVFLLSMGSVTRASTRWWPRNFLVI